ncbi:pyrroline-5-carboxylate reductase [Breoghania corrubedonensis]|uniref:Pyrroline-5-carboxylate reductase n=1 Tax=Breoghania corrubedonensis TaxID=665038 RepID=A0A2T5UNX8_9HYPH|nr:pyrroline-5-carboxylate reductase [Breoghania corrubedonensis]PTW53197.1 pyrroline-5-carboxylate reductase [Breoghania corrubedonensis]
MKLTKTSPLLLVGAGKMGGAMLSGWIEQGIDPAAIVVCDPRPCDEMAALLAAKGIRHIAAASGDLTPGVVLIAVKPQMMADVLGPLKPIVGAQTLVVSIAAGKAIATFEAAFGAVPVVRAMPNTPAQVARGMTALFANPAVSADQKHLVEELLSGIGAVAWLDDEGEMDAVTAVSGSGPAYVFLLAECLAQAGRKAGLPADLADTLARQTVAGAGELLYRSDLDAGTLRKNVTSPGGTTAAALSVLMADDGFQPLLDAAVKAAAERSRELG